MEFKERYDLVTRNIQEIIGEEELKKKLESKKEFSVYWGTMPTGSVSLAYFFPMLKIFLIRSKSQSQSIPVNFILRQFNPSLFIQSSNVVG